MAIANIRPLLIRMIPIVAACFLLTSIGPLFANENIEDLIATCAACHGENGVPQEKTTPVIWGQNEGYMYLQMRDLQKGTRKNEIMQGVVKGLERNQLRALAAHFSKLKWPDLQQPDPSAGVASIAIHAAKALACVVCHQGQYEGDGTTGRMAGQSIDYLAKTTRDFRDGTRANNPGMTTMMRTLTEAEVDALAQYIGTLRIQ